MQLQASRCIDELFIFNKNGYLINAKKGYRYRIRTFDNIEGKLIFDGNISQKINLTVLQGYT